MTGERFAFTSSGLIRQVAALGGSIERLTAIIPPLVIERLKEKAANENTVLARMARDAHMEE